MNELNDEYKTMNDQYQNTKLENNSEILRSQGSGLCGVKGNSMNLFSIKPLLNCMGSSLIR